MKQVELISASMPTSMQVFQFATARSQQEALLDRAARIDSWRWKSIREIYLLEQKINPDWVDYDPYIVDWCGLMTPIELDAWYSIRHYSLPFYPQFPVLRFFVDFGDPLRKIAIECDGKAWHSPARDAARDAELNAAGWQVFRFTGRQCRMDEEAPDGSHMGIRQIAWKLYYRLSACQPAKEVE